MEEQQAYCQKQEEKEAATEKEVGTVQDKCVNEAHHLVGICRIRIEWLRGRRAPVEGYRDWRGRRQRGRSSGGG